MVNVSNRKCVRRLSFRSMKAAWSRNLVAVLAIALTTVLFTSLFTIAMSINDGFQQNNFRQVGGYSHGGFKYLSQSQFEELREDPLIREWGLRRFIAMPSEEPFHKSHVEVGYADANYAHWTYCDPVEGRLPQEGTDEAATDTHVLELLGVTPELGAQFTISFDVDGHPTTQTFTLSGWWEYDEAVVANQVLLPESRVDAILAETGVDPAKTADGMTGSWNLDVMFQNALHINEDMKQVLANHGYQSESRSAGDNFIRTGVNWGYTGAQLAEKMDPMVVIAIAAVLLLIIFTGYLIIYNVFQISVTNDIRFYGLLKTIGTTPRQLRRVIRQQALLLSAVGIPLGLLGGWLVGGALSPVVIARLNGITNVVSVSPVIFVGAALFSLLTVVLSCRKPGRMAGKVSPVEAVRYTEGGGGRKKTRKGTKGAGLFAMARANLGRGRGKTAVTILSLSLAVVLLNLTVMVTNSFDMDKYLAGNVVSDFILADASYFQVGGDSFSADTALPQEAIAAAEAQGGIAAGGRVYGRTSWVEETVSEEYYRNLWGGWYSAEQLEQAVARLDPDGDGRLNDDAQLFGMERFALDKLTVLEGDISRLYEPGGRYIAAVYGEDDYGRARMDSHWARLGDTVTLRYVEEKEYYYLDSGEVIEDLEATELDGDRAFSSRPVKYRDVDYTVAALVSVPHAISYRYYGSDEFVLNDQTFIQDTGTDRVMLYTFDMTDTAANDAMEAFLADYTQQVAPQFDYQSRASYVAEFESMRAMYLMMGGAMSFIVGLVGILNFFNAILTGILSRKREFAVLQSIGMTGRQLKAMLVYEGLLYALGAVLAALALSLVLGPLGAAAVESLFWFFTYRFTVTPILVLAPLFALLGALVPLAVYHFVAKRTIVERLREAE